MEEPKESSLVVTHGHEYDKDRLKKLIDTPLPEIGKVDISPLLRVQTLYQALANSTRLLAATVKEKKDRGKPRRARGPPARTGDVGASANVAETPASSAQNTDGQTEESKDPNLEEQFLEKMIDMVKGMLSCCEVLVDVAGGAALKERPEPFVATLVPKDKPTQVATWKEWLHGLDRNVLFSEDYRKGMAQLCRAQRGLKKELTKLQGKLPSRPDSQEGIEDVEELETKEDWSWIGDETEDFEEIDGVDDSSEIGN
ncbi:uncharacterized protein LDX57_000270 [Aspergillus melleus]|uniref:uncharacterized protein n=1 Tax=Aspergillus melleus TaxID=138277 RepID=UPI001E8DEA0A|nr:uncharacterized protein LDX57_000270 [Aspergillus melleus]KAH8422516.1 hypothetical protein LDX57_000270 [Aspergillus melleus]